MWKQDLDIGLHIGAVDRNPAPTGSLAQIDQILLVPRIMLNHAIAAGDLRPQHLRQLAVGVAPVGSQGIDQHDIVAGNVRQFLQEHGQDPVVGHGAREVAENDGDGVLWRHQFPQRRGAQRLSQPSSQGCGLVR